MPWKGALFIAEGYLPFEDFSVRPKDISNNRS